MEQRLVGPREFRAQCGDGVSFHRRTAGEADVLEFADGRAGAVAAHQVTAAPPGAGGPRVWAVTPDAPCSMPSRRLSTATLTSDSWASAVRRTSVSSCWAMQRRRVGVAEDDLARHLLAPHRPPSGPTETQPRQRCAGQPLDEGDGVLAQDDGPRGARFVLARPFVENDTGHLPPRQRQGEREPHGPRSGDDHRVHGATPLPVTVSRGTWVNRTLEQGARLQNVGNLLPLLASSDGGSGDHATASVDGR